MNCLLLYNATQTYTNTVHEHLAAFSTYSRHTFFFVHHDQYHDLNVKPGFFDSIGIHYSVRLPYDQISESAARLFESFVGLKWLFIQDEYNFTYRAWYWIKRLGIDLVFTVVPAGSINRVYPATEFPKTRFISVLTGYAPESIPEGLVILPPSQRSVLIGYRGRNLPVEYGALGREKAGIGRLVRNYADTNRFHTDIEWTESTRIYGAEWYPFIASCRSMLGSESGSNVFDWDGTLPDKVARFRAETPEADDSHVYEKLVKPLEQPGLMNQISPRVFESIALRTVLVLFEGQYSGILVSDRHYIALRKDGSNLKDVFRQLEDSQRVDKMADQAYEELIASGQFSYSTFVTLFDNHLQDSWRSVRQPANPDLQHGQFANPTALTMFPIRASPVPQFTVAGGPRVIMKRLLIKLWLILPDSLRSTLKPLLKALRGA